MRVIESPLLRMVSYATLLPSIYEHRLCVIVLVFIFLFFHPVLLFTLFCSDDNVQWLEEDENIKDITHQKMDDWRNYIDLESGGMH